MPEQPRGELVIQTIAMPGRTSMTIPVEVWVTRYMTGEELRVTHGVFTFVAIDECGKPIPVKRD